MMTAERSASTPGPWFAQPGFLTIFNLSGGTTGLTCAIATVLSDQPGMDAAKANARLIAAAPELLEALKGVLRVADRKTVEFDAARSAIAKAEGGAA